MKRIGMTKFALRHWSLEFAGTKIVEMPPDELVAYVEQKLTDGAELKDGYAPFCKHLFILNVANALAGVAEITSANQHLLRSGYEARREGELPVLVRWFDHMDVAPPRATALDIVLYSREQLALEDAGKPEAERDVPDAEWGIVSVNAEMGLGEAPMPPATMVRNALGKDEGGSGVPLDREAYLRAVEYWTRYAVVRWIRFERELRETQHLA